MSSEGKQFITVTTEDTHSGKEKAQVFFVLMFSYLSVIPTLWFF